MEAKDEIKTKRNMFLHVSDADVEKSMFFKAELKLPYQHSLIFLISIMVSWMHFQYSWN